MLTSKACFCHSLKPSTLYFLYTRKRSFFLQSDLCLLTHNKSFVFITEDSHEKMNFMISMLARSQSKRLNEQRVSLSSLPGMRVAEASNSLDNPPSKFSETIEKSVMQDNTTRFFGFVQNSIFVFCFCN